MRLDSKGAVWAGFWKDLSAWLGGQATCRVGGPDLQPLEVPNCGLRVRWGKWNRQARVERIEERSRGYLSPEIERAADTDKWILSGGDACGWQGVRDSQPVGTVVVEVLDNTAVEYWVRIVKAGSELYKSQPF